MASLRGVLTGLAPGVFGKDGPYGSTAGLGLSQPIGVVVDESATEIAYETPSGALVVDDSGFYTGATGATNFDAVSTCLRVITDAIRAVPLYTADSDGETVETVLDDLIREPNPYTRWPTLIEQIIADYLLWGDAFLLVERAGKRPTAVWHIPAARVDVRFDREAAAVVYDVQGSRLMNPPGGLINVAHFIRQPRTSFPPRGQSVISGLRAVVGHGIAADQYVERTAHDGRQRYALKAPGKLAKNQRAAIGESWKSATHGARTWNATPVLEDGVEPVPLSMSMVDMDLLANVKLDRLRIAGAFGVPAILIADYDKASFANSAQQDRAFVKYAVAPLLNELRTVLHAALLNGEPEWTVEYDLDALTRSEPLTLVKQKAQEIQAGIRGPEKCAADMGYDWDESDMIGMKKGGGKKPKDPANEGGPGPTTEEGDEADPADGAEA